ncbi:MAG: ATP-binding cassette domain-containing protein [Alphaproteobacteria bacterium]|nr:ATP-binding cassette domain-containing protein [Alphaproteobacteria bacterium]
MSGKAGLRAALAALARTRRGVLILAAACGLGAGLAASLILGLSGGFLAGAALAGLGGYATVHAFNYLLPSAALRGLAIVRGGARYGERMASHTAALEALAELRPALFQALLATPPQKALSLASGEAAGRLMQDVDAVETAFARRAAPWMAGGAILAGAAGAALASSWAALAVLIGAGLQLAALPGLAAWTIAAPARRQLAASGDLKSGLGAYLAAATELRIFNLIPQALTALKAHEQVLLDAGVARRDAEAGLEAIRALISAASLVAVAIAAAHASLPREALALLAALAGLEGPAVLLAAGSERGALRAAQARLDAVFAASPPAKAPALAPPSPAAKLSLDGLRLEPGARWALVGPSGAGKTSLLEMCLGLRPATPGRIVIGETPLEQTPEGWARRLFAWAPQDPRLTTGPLGEALRLGAPEAPDEDILALIDAFGLTERLRQTSDGLDMWIGEGGEILSGGERRRLSLIRALLRPAPWLLLDEPTEGLDPEVEARVVAGLRARLDRTGQGLILVSHRPAPLALCSNLARLDAPGQRLAASDG